MLTDLAHGDKSKLERLRRSGLLNDGHVFSADTYAEKPEADIEDIIGDEFYIDLVNRALGLEGGNRIKLPIDGGRIVKWVEEQARILPTEVPEYDHYMPAAFLLALGSGEVLAGNEVALNRFEKLFIDLNKILPT